MKIYISGPISGIEINIAYQIFEKAENKLLNEGYEVVNPMKLDHSHGKTWTDYMKEDLKAMMDCDAIFMLPQWRSSAGAKIEHDLAKKLGIDIFYFYKLLKQRKT